MENPLFIYFLFFFFSHCSSVGGPESSPGQSLFLSSTDLKPQWRSRQVLHTALFRLNLFNSSGNGCRFGFNSTVRLVQVSCITAWENPVFRSALTCGCGTHCCSVSSTSTFPFRPCCQSASLHSWHAPSRPAPSPGTSTPPPSLSVPELPQSEWPAQELVLELCSAASSLATPGNNTCQTFHFPCRDLKKCCFRIVWVFQCFCLFFLYWSMLPN